MPGSGDGSGTPLSARNPKVQHVRRLARRRTSRAEAGEYLVDGPTLVTEALEAGVPLRTVLLDVAAPAHVTAVAARAQQAGADLHHVTADVLARAADVVHPQGLVAVAAGRPRTIDELLGGHLAEAVVLVDVADPGNVGTIVRTAEAAGAAAVVLVGDCADPLSPKAVRAAAGSAFRVPLAVERDRRTAIGELRSAGLRLVGAVLAGGVPYTEVDLDGDVAVVLGSEAHGLPPDVEELLDERACVPMRGAVESLNVAVVAALLCFELARRGTESRG